MAEKLADLLTRLTALDEIREMGTPVDKTGPTDAADNLTKLLYPSFVNVGTRTRNVNLLVYVKHKDDVAQEDAWEDEESFRRAFGKQQTVTPPAPSPDTVVGFLVQEQAAGRILAWRMPNKTLPFAIVVEEKSAVLAESRLCWVKPKAPRTFELIAFDDVAKFFNPIQ